MSDDGTLPAPLRTELARADRAVNKGVWRHDSLAAALTDDDGTKIKFNFQCTPKMPDVAQRAEPEAVGEGKTPQGECVRRVQDMINLLRAELPARHKAWIAACEELLADEPALTLLLFSGEGKGTPWHTDWARGFNVAFALSKAVSTTM